MLGLYDIYKTPVFPRGAPKKNGEKRVFKKRVGAGIWKKKRVGGGTPGGDPRRDSRDWIPVSNPNVDYM